LQDVVAASIIDVARRAGVSKSTVSRVLTNDGVVRPATRARIEQAMRDLGYRPNGLARGLIQGRTRTLGLVVFDLPNPFFGLLARGVEAAARARGYNLLICDSAGSAVQQQECLTMLAERRVDGVLNAPFHSMEQELDTIRSVGLKAVLVNSTAGDDTVSSVGGDNRRGGLLVTRHLLALGHRRVGFLGDLRTTASCRERLAGYRHAHEEEGIALDPALVIDDLPGLEAAQAAVHRLLDLPHPPTALFAVNDQFAAAVLQELIKRGCRVPGDVALVGYDDTPLAAWLTVPLTTVAQGTEEQGRIAADLLIDQIEDPDALTQSIVLQPRLVIRQSCGARGATVSADPPPLSARA